MASKLPPKEVQRQLSHKDEFNAGGLAPFLITIQIVSTIAVGMRFWARRMAKVSLRSDDYTLLAALVRR